MAGLNGQLVTVDAPVGDPHVLAAEIADDLRAALEQIEDVLAGLRQRAEK